MWDAKAQQYKFLEINTRAWKWHTISNQLGFSFIGELINSFDIGNWKLVNGKLEENSENKGENIKNNLLEDSKPKMNHPQSSDDDSPSIDPKSAHMQASGQPSAQSCANALPDYSYLDKSRTIISEKNELLHNSEKNTKNIYRDGKPVAWVERLTDWTVVAKEILHGRMIIGEVVRSYRIKHESAVWKWKDPLPAIMYVLLSPILYIKRH